MTDNEYIRVQLFKAKLEEREAWDVFQNSFQLLCQKRKTLDRLKAKADSIFQSETSRLSDLETE